jgi:iron(III) transport system permease protein
MTQVQKSERDQDIVRPSRSEPTPGPRGRSRPWRDPKYLLLGIAAAIVAYLALVPVGTVIYASFRTSFLTTEPSRWTFDNYKSVFTSSSFLPLLGNSFVFAAATTIICVVLGFVLAWLVTSSNAPGKAFGSVAALVPLIIPGLLNTIAWSFMLSPNAGPINHLLSHVGLPRFDIYSLPGMIFVQSTHVVPLAFLMGVAAFRAKDPSFEEAALASGASPMVAFVRFTLRMARPAAIAAALLIFVQTFSTFEVPQLIGVPGHTFVFVSKIYSALEQFPADYGTVGVISVVIALISTLGLIGFRLAARGAETQSITGKAFRPSTTDLGRWRWPAFAFFLLFFMITVALPVALLIWSSFLPGYQNPSFHALHALTFGNYRSVWHTPGLIKSVENSLIVSIGTAAVVTLLSAVVAYITVKSKLRGRAALDLLAAAPIAVPTIVTGVGILYWYLVAPLPFDLYGTLLIIIVSFVTITLPYALRYLSAGIAQVSDVLEEAALVNGATWTQSLRKIFLPLIVPSLLSAFLYSMIISLREISAAVFLYSDGTQVVSVSMFQYWTNGSFPIVAALGVLMIAVTTILAVVIRFMTRRLGIQVQ